MPQVAVEYFALFIAVASLLLTSWKITVDRKLIKELLTVQRSERAIRENTERNENASREAFELGLMESVKADREMRLSAQNEFETTERTLRARFMSGQDRALMEAEARIKTEIEDYVKLEKWREETWQRNLTRLEQASKNLIGTTAGLISLIDEGPFYDDARMIEETARVLDVFGDFQTSVSHFAIPPELSGLSKALVGQVTRILLTLSPHEKIRKSHERKAMLTPLRKELQHLSNVFVSRCGDFERDPSSFFSVSQSAPERECIEEAADFYLSEARVNFAK